MFYLTTHSTHCIYGYMASDIWLRTILIVRKETCCCHMGYSFQLKARVLLYAPSHRQDSTYHGLCCTSRGSLAWTRVKKECYLLRQDSATYKFSIIKQNFQATISVKISKLFICFCNFYLSCPILEKENFIKQIVHYIVLSY